MVNTEAGPRPQTMLSSISRSILEAGREYQLLPPKEGRILPSGSKRTAYHSAMMVSSGKQS